MKKWAAWVCVTGLALSMLSGCGKEETVDAPMYPEYPTYTAKDYVTLGDYKNLTVQVTSISESPTEEEITARLQEAMSQEAVDEDATVQMGDTVAIDLKGTVDGETFEGGTSENYSVTIGSGKLIDGFEDQMIGMTAGQTKTLDVTFPDTYKREDLAGKTARFTITVKTISRYPEVTDENASELSGGSYKTVEEWREAVSEELVTEKRNQNKAAVRQAITNQLGTICEVKEVPEELFDWYVDSMMVNYEYQANSADQTLEEYLSEVSDGEWSSEEDVRAYLEPNKESTLANELILHAVAEDQGMTITEEEYKEQLEEMADRYGFSSGEMFERSYPKSNIESAMLVEEAMNYLAGQVTIEETTAGE